jgi:dihydrofolate synthase/folylpolyglutamate synthase
MNYRQTMDYLFARLPMFHRVGAAAYRVDLTNTIALCKILGNPENNFKSVHIAGTNGKGSTSHLVAACLQSAGYKTGLFTSPHLKDFRERIRIDGKKIPKSYVSDFVTHYKRDFDFIKPSFFEYTAVMAFNYFAEENVDVAVIETGMGGRLDSTNVITPLACIITNISKDHTAFLGNTLHEIAGEKAGIIKPGIPVVIGETQAETSVAFISKANEMKAPILFADQNYKLRLHRDSISIMEDGVPVKRASISSSRDGVPVKCPLRGSYQHKNFITAYQALMLLKDLGFSITETDIKNGFKNVVRITGLQGRWQKINSNPKAICDVGHNEAGIGYILEQLKDEEFEKLHWVFGLVNDKDAESIMKMMPVNAVYYFCKADIPRGLDVDELKKKADSFGLKGRIYTSVNNAYQAALEGAGANDLVFVGGSTFIVAEVL